MSTHIPANNKRIGILATGSELTTGEILNTNAQTIAQELQALGIAIGEHLVVDDTQSNIESALQYLLSRHDAIITIGGLGPTSDDLTRFALNSVINSTLIFNEQSWQRIVERLSRRNIAIPENNRQQAFFPENATIIINTNGTADACYVPFQNKHLFMLPGPPRECIPIFNESVLPKLLALQFASHKRLHRWRLMGISESLIAEQLENFGKPYRLQFAYRAAYPYIDIKLMLEEDEHYTAIKNGINQLLKDYLVTSKNLPISLQMQQALCQFPHQITICDLATKGTIAARFLTPQNHQKLVFSDTPSQNYCVVVSGLTEYWQNAPHNLTTEIKICLRHHEKEENYAYPIYIRGQETLDYAVEIVAHKIHQTWLVGL